MLLRLASLAFFTLLLAVGQIFFKQVGLAIRNQPIPVALLSMARQPALYAALTLYGLSTLLWVGILSRVPLMQAYPWVAANVVIVPLIGWFVFGERVTPAFWLGVTLIMTGIVLTQAGTST
jgi:drug/metabolite transporter (DMT)-like permease